MSELLTEELLEKLNSTRPKEKLRHVVLDYDDGIDAKYVGQINSKGQWHGYGVYTDNVGVGRREEGQFRYGLKCGHCTVIHHTGSKYIGEFKHGQEWGQGKRISHKGYVYEGGWMNGKEYGQGKYTSPDGKVYEGEWKDIKKKIDEI